MVSYVGGEFGPSKSPLDAFAERGGVLIAEAGSGGEGGSPGDGGDGGEGCLLYTSPSPRDAS